MNEYLASDDVIDWQHPDVVARARMLTGVTPLETAQRCFEWVRDEIRHSYDYQMNPVTCRASDVLQAGTGYCYAKSHLLAALLRANGIPAGLCYQRLRVDENEDRYSLHGLNAVYLPEFGWYRIDARGNKSTVNAQFVPPVEQLAFPVEADGEILFDDILAEPLPQVVTALNAYESWGNVWRNLPDAPSDVPLRTQASS